MRKKQPSDQYCFEILTFYSDPMLSCFRKEGDEKKHFPIEFADPNQENIIREMMIESIKDYPGGSLDSAREFPLSKKLRQFIMKEIKEGRIKIKVW